MTRRAVAVAGLVAALAAPRASHAYVRGTAAKGGLPAFWEPGCQVVTVYLNGFTQLTADEVAKSVAAAAHAWSPEAVTCPGTGDGGAGSGHPSFEIITQMAAGGPVAEAGADVGVDGTNALIFRTDDWPYLDALALTWRHTDPSGRIVDADIEVNAARDVTWANLDPNGPPAMHGVEPTDLQTALTHEFGHFLGLGHTCFNTDIDMGAPPLDDQGRPSPICTSSDVTDTERAAVMWYQVDPYLTDKRVLTTDDARGVCAIYPPSDVPLTCAANLPEDGCGCRTGGAPGGGGAALIATAALLGLRRRSRRRAG